MKTDTFLLFENKKTVRNYQIYDKYEAGMVLDSLLLRKTLRNEVSLSSCHGWIKEREIFLRNYGSTDKGEFVKLLLNKSEIKRIIRLVNEKKYQLIPTKTYLKNHKVKITIALAKYDKQLVKNKEIQKSKEKSWKKVNLSEHY